MEAARRIQEPFTQPYYADLVLDNEGVTLWYYPELKLIHHQMHTMPESAQFRELLTRGADIVERFHANKWLSDDRNNKVLREEDNVWADRVWLPRVLDGGFRYWAIVPPFAAIGKLNMKRLAREHSEHGITSVVMETPQAAMQWLLQQV